MGRSPRRVQMLRCRLTGVGEGRPFLRELARDWRDGSLAEARSAVARIIRYKRGRDSALTTPEHLYRIAHHIAGRAPIRPMRARIGPPQQKAKKKGAGSTCGE